MWTLLFCIILWKQKDALATFQVYKYERTTDEAELHCEGQSGELLGYGPRLLEAARYCGVTEVVTKRPWYQQFGCYGPLRSSPTLAGEKDFASNHLANCATFCPKSTVFIGVQINRCLCYTSPVGLTSTGNCDGMPCPGNPMETCGTNSMIMYRKVTTLPDAGCQFVFITGNGYNVTSTDCSIPRNFICDAGNRTLTNIECLNANGQTDPPAVIPQENLVDNSSSSLGVILGVIVAVFVLIAIVIVVVIYLLRKRRKDEEDKHTIHPSPATRRSENNGDFINAYREPSDFRNINLNLRDPVPIVAFGGDGVDLDRESTSSLAPVYSAVHKKPSATESTKLKPKAEPAYDEVYQPSYSTNGTSDNKIQDNVPPTPNERTTSIGKYAGIHKGHAHQTHRNSSPAMQNELSQNKLFNNRQSRQRSVDDLY